MDGPVSEWRRADLGDPPVVGDIITLVEYRIEDSTVKVWDRLQVEIVMGEGGAVRVYGATSHVERRLRDLPDRPVEFAGPKALLWKERD